MRINGIGTAYLGFCAKDDQNRCCATLWVTIFFAPVLPLARHHLQLLPYPGFGICYRVLGKTRLSGGEILRTYLYGWVLFPLLLLGPLALAALVVNTVMMPAWVAVPIILLAMVWMGVVVWKLINWDDARGKPRTGRSASAGDETASCD